MPEKKPYEEMSFPGLSFSMKFQAPDECPYCKVKVAELPAKTRTVIDGKEGSLKGFIGLHVPGTNIVAFQCPICHGLMGNIYAAENAIRLSWQRDSKIIVAAANKSMPRFRQ